MKLIDARNLIKLSFGMEIYQVTALKFKLILKLKMNNYKLNSVF